MPLLHPSVIAPTLASKPMPLHSSTYSTSRWLPCQQSLPFHSNASPNLHAICLSVYRFTPCQQQEGVSVDGSQEDLKYFVDEDNHTALAGIRACKEEGSYETAISLLRACEARWAMGSVARDEEKGGGAEGTPPVGHEWPEMLVRTRLSRR